MEVLPPTSKDDQLPQNSSQADEWLAPLMNHLDLPEQEWQMLLADWASTHIVCPAEYLAATRGDLSWAEYRRMAFKAAGLA